MRRQQLAPLIHDSTSAPRCPRHHATALARCADDSTGSSHGDTGSSLSGFGSIHWCKPFQSGPVGAPAIVLTSEGREPCHRHPCSRQLFWLVLRWRQGGEEGEGVVAGPTCPPLVLPWSEVAHASYMPLCLLVLICKKPIKSCVLSRSWWMQIITIDSTDSFI